MPPELTNDQELSLKKRARRRLVGAIALVLLMVIVLPMVLQDRVSLTPPAAVKITMPEMPSSVATNTENQSVATPSASAHLSEPPVMAGEGASPNVVSDEALATSKADSIKNGIEKRSDESKKAVVKSEDKLEVKEVLAKLPEVKSDELKPAESKVQQKNSESFAIQIGVYSDGANIKQLQAKLKEAGYVSYSEKITTDKGEKTRLRAGNYPSRQEASVALVKLQKAGFSGIVISHE